MGATAIPTKIGDATMRHTQDITRQIVVGASAVIAVIGALVGSGRIGGTAIQNAAGGALSEYSTLITPAGPAFAIWSIIYSGLVAYAVWQFLPAQSSSERHRRLGYWIAASMILNAAWIICAQFAILAGTLIVIILMLGVLGWSFVLCLRHQAHATLDGLLTDGTVGLYLGWICIATAANTAAVLTAADFSGFEMPPEIWAIIVLAVAASVGVMLAVIGRGRIAPALSLSWGIAWVAVGRLTGELLSTPTAIASVISAVIVLGVTIGIRVRRKDIAAA
ncbi:MAG: tryptophan-rich sensory protein [Rhodoglobus sp.]